MAGLAEARLQSGQRTEREMKSKDKEMYRELALFRHRLRKFLRFSEDAARAGGITPQQHQLMLGIAGFTGAGRASISEIAEFLQERHNSVVGLVDRAFESGLVQRTEDPVDRRVVVVSLTERGEEILKKLSLLHHDEVKRLRREFSSTEDAQTAERLSHLRRGHGRGSQQSAN